MVKAKKFTAARQISGQVKESDLTLVEETLPALKDGEALFEAVYLSVDPYMRLFASSLKVGDTINGEQVARVIESRNAFYPKDSVVLAKFGWRSHTVVEGLGEKYEIRLLDKDIFSDVPLSLSLGTLGMPGATAYFGLHDYGLPKAGETFLVNAAAGAVGHVVGQMAKLRGCKVIGYAGSDVKCEWLKQLGFDHAFNYKTQNIDKTLDEAAPNGVDIFYDHVGGDFAATVISKHMAQFGRVVVIGCISEYNLEKPLTAPTPWKNILLKRLKVQGMVIYDYPTEKWIEPFRVMKQWILEGKLKYKETVTEGFENMPKAFIGLFSGENIGKAVVKV